MKLRKGARPNFENVKVGRPHYLESLKVARPSVENEKVARPNFASSTLEVDTGGLWGVAARPAAWQQRPSPRPSRSTLEGHQYWVMSLFSPGGQEVLDRPRESQLEFADAQPVPQEKTSDFSNSGHGKTMPNFENENVARANYENDNHVLMPNFENWKVVTPLI